MKNKLILTALLVYCLTSAQQQLSESQLMEYITMNSGYMYNTQILQLGNENQAVIDANNIELTQIGEGQQFYYTETSIIPSEIKVNIEGNGSYVEIYGNNQIMNNVTINIEGDNRNVIIRNYP